MLTKQNTLKNYFCHLKKKFKNSFKKKCYQKNYDFKIYSQFYDFDHFF